MLTSMGMITYVSFYRYATDNTRPSIRCIFAGSVKTKLSLVKQLSKQVVCGDVQNSIKFRRNVKMRLK